MAINKKIISDSLDNLKKNHQFPLPDFNFSELIALLCRENFEKITPYTPEFLTALYDRILKISDHNELEKLRKWCELGPARAKVDAVEEIWSDEPDGEFSDFEIF